MTTREVFHADALAWLAANPAPEGASVVTSMPDVSEVPMGFDAWRAWFLECAKRVIAWVPERGVSVFFQSDVRHEGEWVDKGYLVLRAADELGAHVLFHAIVCRKPPGTLATGRATYSHLIAVSRTKRPPKAPRADVLESAGHMTWSRAMGVRACAAACEYLRDETETRVVVDPFCGYGTVLAVANDMGFSAIGVDSSEARCKKARALRLPPSALD